MRTFIVRTTSRFDHALIKLSKQHAELPRIFEEAITLLKSDPHNVSRKHAIKKLRGIKPGEGQYRLRVGRWRFRYDIWDQEVEVNYCGLRREDTYR
jgi:mRNA-degrading endonuclease RelE of RelBE toxin-antitoxin system